MSYHHGLDGIGTVFSAAQKVVEDPCLVPLATMVLRLNELEQRGARKPALPSGKPAPAPAPAPAVKGIGLCHAIKPMQAVLWVRERPWVLPVGGIAVVGGLVALGYALGRRR